MKINEICNGYVASDISLNMINAQFKNVSDDKIIKEKMTIYDSNKVGFFTSFFCLLKRSLISQVIYKVYVENFFMACSKS